MIKNYAPNEILFNEGEVCTSIGTIQSGQIEISTLNSAAEEYIISIKKTGDSFGELLALSSHPYYPGTLKALEPTTVLYIPATDYLSNQIQTNSINFIKHLADEGISFQNKVKVLSQTSLKDRLLFYLQEQVKHQRTSSIYIESKEQLAKILAMPRPSLSRLLSTLKKEHLIDYNKHYIILL